MALSADEQKLLDFALGGLPWWFSDPERDMEIEGAMAKMHGSALTIQRYWMSQTLISEALGATGNDPDWLNQHAIDRGTRRQASETDAALRARLRQYPDALTRPLLLAIAQQMVDDAGVSGDVAMVELRADRAYLVTNDPWTGTGGTFEGGGFVDPARFTPDVLPWPRPPFVGAGLPGLVQTYKLVISGAASSQNNGTYTINDLDLDTVLYTDTDLIEDVDPTCTWRIDRYDADGDLLTGGTGRAHSYLSRGFRMGSSYPTIILILPFGSTEALATAVLEAVRQRKAAGVRVLVERRLNP